MDSQEPTTEIVQFPDGKNLSLEEARSGAYVFALGPAGRPLYAFRLEDAERLITKWAEEQGVVEHLKHARKLTRTPPDEPDDPGSVERLRSELMNLSEELGIPIGDPDLLRAAHERGILDSALLFSQPLYGVPQFLPLTSDCGDLSLYGVAEGALSCQTLGYEEVHLFSGANFQPEPPLARLYGCDNIDDTVLPVMSARFFA